METWTVDAEDRRASSPHPGRRLWPLLTAIVLVAGAGAAYYYVVRQPVELPPWEVAAPKVAPAPEPAPAPAPQAVEETAIRHPLERPAAPEVPQVLPALNQSDSMMRESVAGLVGGPAFEQIVIPDALVLRIVATVDNLPRPTAPRRMLPLNPVPGRFAVGGTGEVILDESNYRRYSAYVRVMESVDTRALVRTYVRAYPLFQRAYEELGYPGKYFNDRLIEAIDNLLATPQIDGPLRLEQPRVLYQFADPELEGRSAGQKAMLRMGPANAARVKAKLREIRRELTAASARSRR